MEMRLVVGLAAVVLLLAAAVFAGRDPESAAVAACVDRGDSVCVQLLCDQGNQIACDVEQRACDGDGATTAQRRCGRAPRRRW